MREIDVSKITDALCEMCMSINYELSDDMKKALKEAQQKETAPLGK